MEYSQIYWQIVIPEAYNHSIQGVCCNCVFEVIMNVDNTVYYSVNAGKKDPSLMKLIRAMCLY